MAEKFTPLSNIGKDEHDRIISSVEFPFGLHKKIGIDADRTMQLMQLAGVATMDLTNTKTMETSKPVFGPRNTTGINSDGSATSGIGIENEVKPSIININKIGSFPAKHASWSELKIAFNPAEISQRIRLNGGVVTKTDNWAEEVDKAIKKAVRTSATKNLIFSGNNFERALFTYLYAQTAIKMTSDIATLPFSPILVVGEISRLLMPGLLNQILNVLIEGKERPGRGTRLSMFYLAEIDRWSMVQGLSRINKLAEPLE